MKWLWLIIVSGAIAGLTTGCSNDGDESDAVADPTAGAPREDVADEPIGPLHFRNASARLGDLFQPGGRGVSLVDFNDDGWPDVTILAQNNIHLFRGVTEGLFLPVGEPIEFDFGMAATWADVDGDGDLDLYVSSNLKRHGLFLNNAGVLTEATDAAGLGGQMPLGGQGASFGDVDGDGDLDLYLSFAAPPLHLAPQPTPELGYGGSSNRLYINEGGRFTRGDDSIIGGLSDGETFMGMLFDADDDNDLDLFVVHDGRPDEYFENTPAGFVDSSATRLPNSGKESTSIMGVAIADYDGDGDLDIYGTQRGEDVLYDSNDGRWTNTWPNQVVGYDPTPQITGWGNALADIDNDGDVDVIATSNYESIAGQRAGTPLGNRVGWMVIMRTDAPSQTGGPRTLHDASESSGSLFSHPIDGFGLAVGDIDRDGDIDILVGVDSTGDKADPDAHQRPLLLVNDGTDSAERGWLGITIRQSGPNPFAVGASVSVVGLGIRTRRPILAGTGYLSQDSYRQHFGLGRYQRAPAVVVRWPDGAKTVWLDVPSGELRVDRSAGTCCTSDGCDDADESTCLGRLSERYATRCESICASLRTCCNAPSTCEASCAAMPPPEWSAQCLQATGCSSVPQCLGDDAYRFPGTCVPDSP